KHSSGALIQVAVTCSPVRDESGHPIAVSCIARDIRQQKLQERLLAESHRRLKQALESADLSLWDWDVASSRVHYDEAFARLLGYSPSELPSEARPWGGLIHPDDAKRVGDCIDSHLAGNCELGELEFRVRRRDGEWVRVVARGLCVAH